MLLFSTSNSNVPGHSFQKMHFIEHLREADCNFTKTSTNVTVESESYQLSDPSGYAEYTVNEIVFFIEQKHLGYSVCSHLMLGLHAASYSSFHGPSEIFAS